MGREAEGGNVFCRGLIRLLKLQKISSASKIRCMSAPFNFKSCFPQCAQYTGAAADPLCKAKRKLWEVMKNVSKSLTELKIQELLNFVETKMQAIEGRGVQGGECQGAKWRLNVEKWQQS